MVTFVRLITLVRMRKFIITILLVVVGLGIRAQSVGVVFSGGGAKGLYHIGILKALEENNIPIDYVAGTSMGSIVAGLYAIGYTPQQMNDLFVSDLVKVWMSGKIEPKYAFFYKQQTPAASMISVNIDRNKLGVKALSGSLIPSHAIDVTFNELFAGATALTKGDFDKLFVPFRCVAADVYHRKELVFKKGDIGAAIRMSMSIPIVFKPMKIDSTLIFDGGIYNNFPWKTIDEDFSPDVIIGGKCVSDIMNPDESNLVGQVEMLTMMHTNYDLPQDRGIMIERIFKDIGILDFDKAQIIIDRGYADAMAAMPQIKEKIARRVSPDSLAMRRLNFRSQLPELIYNKLEIEGLTPVQMDYVDKLLKIDHGKNKTFTFDKFKSSYFKMLSEGDITGDFPFSEYNDSLGVFSLKMKMQAKPSLKVMFGGNISSGALNELFFGAEYKRIGRTLKSYYMDGFIGNYYVSGRAGLRTDFIAGSPFYADFLFTFNRYNYLNGSNSNSSPYIRQMEHFASASVGFPIGRKSVASFYTNIGQNNYKYRQSTDGEESNSRFRYAEIRAHVEHNTLNHKLYPTRGARQLFSGVYVFGDEYSTNRTRHHWIGGKMLREDYINAAKWFKLGWLVDMVVTTRHEMENEYVTNFTQPAFMPTPHSHTLFLPEYRSDSYLGLGLMPTFCFTPNFYLRNDLNMFMPESFFKVFNVDNKARYMLSSTLVYQSIIGPASLTIANYDGGRGRWFVVFNFGRLLFNRSGLSY